MYHGVFQHYEVFIKLIKLYKYKTNLLKTFYTQLPPHADPKICFPKLKSRSSQIGCLVLIHTSDEPVECRV